MHTSFSDLALRSEIVQALEHAFGFAEPTGVQAESIGLFLQKQDIIVQAQTGSGKTIAYLAPIVHLVQPQNPQMQALILAPTHELVMQIYHVLQKLVQSCALPIRVQPLIGEANIHKQIEKLKQKPHILVGTPGRVLDLFRKRKLNGQTIKIIVLDEADNLLDNTNRQGVLDCIKSTQRDRQLAAYSASISEQSRNCLLDQMNNAAFVNISRQQLMNPAITHQYLLCDSRDKFDMLRKLLAAVKPNRALVFQNNGERIDLTSEKLNYHKLSSHCLYSRLHKEQRQQALEEFRSGKAPILVSSDLSARGLDIPEVSHVINLDFPLSANEYIHRAGRTARGNAAGHCISIITPKEKAALRVYQREFTITIEPIHLYKGTVFSGEPREFAKKRKTSSQTTASSSKKSSAGKDRANASPKPTAKRNAKPPSTASKTKLSRKNS